LPKAPLTRLKMQSSVDPVRHCGYDKAKADKMIKFIDKDTDL